jgi:hypothetical protein
MSLPNITDIEELKGIGVRKYSFEHYLGRSLNLLIILKILALVLTGILLCYLLG